MDDILAISIGGLVIWFKKKKALDKCSTGMVCLRRRGADLKASMDFVFFCFWVIRTGEVRGVSE